MDNTPRLQRAALLDWMRHEHPDLQAALTDIAGLTSTAINADRVGVWLFIDDEEKLVCQALHPNPKQTAASDVSHSNLARDLYPRYFSAIKEENYVCCSVVDQTGVVSELLESYYRPLGIVSMLDVPVRKSGALIGVLRVESRLARDWTDADIQFAAMAAVLITLSLESSERRAADRRLLDQQQDLQRVLDTIVEGVVTVDHTGQILSHNLAAEQILGYSPGELSSVTVDKLSPSVIAKAPVGSLLEVIQTAGVAINDSTQEYQAKRKDGQLILIRLSIVELPTGPNGHLQYVGSFVDITAEKAQQERLRRSEALESLGHLSGGIAHDFNNMLGVVLGYAELIHLQATASQDTDTASKAEKIIHAGRRGSELTRRLLAFSHPSPGAAKSVIANDLLEASADLLCKTLTPRIDFVLKTAPDCWPVHLDPGDFEDAILNLAVNAMHAIDQRGKLEMCTENRRVTARRASTLEISPGDYVLVTVSDDGKGMDKATLKRAYEPFFTSRPGEGSGLGLSQVYGFIQRVNGGVIIKSRPGQGTQVELYFPRHHGADQSSAEEFSSGDRPIIKRPGSSILVVDDEPSLRQLVEAVLGDAGYQVVLAKNGQEALTLAGEQDFDLVLSDVIMPVMDGYQLSTALLQSNPDQKILLMTGYEQSAHRSDGYSIPVALRKPFTTLELIEVVNEALKK